MCGSAWFSHQVLTPRAGSRRRCSHARQMASIRIRASGCLYEEFNCAGVDQLRFRPVMAVAAACGAGLFVAEHVPELLTHAVPPSVQGLRAGTATGSRSTVSLVARGSLTF